LLEAILPPGGNFPLCSIHLNAQFPFLPVFAVPEELRQSYQFLLTTVSSYNLYTPGGELLVKKASGKACKGSDYPVVIMVCDGLN